MSVFVIRAAWRCAFLALLVVGVTTPALAQDFKQDDAALAKHARDIGVRAGGIDGDRAAARLADEFGYVLVKTSAADRGRALRSADVRALRATGLGYGEIAIVLSLYANQPVSSFHTLEQIAALKQPGQGWGQVAKALGYQNLGIVRRDVARAGKAIDATTRTRVEVPRKTDASKTLDKSERPEKPDTPRRIEKPERPEKVGR